MSMISLFTAKGAPGATTDAILVAALWPRRALLIDCDPAGGDIALRLPAENGSSLDVSTGMLSLLPLARRPMQPADVLAHAQIALGGTEILSGLASPDQAIAAGGVWSALADLFAALPEHDAVIDVGRLHPTSAVLPLARRSDLAVCVVQASLSGTVAARSRLRTVLPALSADGVGPRCGFVVRAADRTEAEAAARVLYDEFESLSYFGWLPDDPVGASLFDGGRVARPERTMLVRSGVVLVEQLDAALPPDGKRGEQMVVANGNRSTAAPPVSRNGATPPRGQSGAHRSSPAAGSPPPASVAPPGYGPAQPPGHGPGLVPAGPVPPGPVAPPSGDVKARRRFRRGSSV